MLLGVIRVGKERFISQREIGVLTESVIDILKQEGLKSSLVRDVQLEISTSSPGNAAHAKAGSSKESHPEVCTPNFAKVVDEMLRANKLIQLEGPRKVGEFGKSGDSGEISPRLLTK